MMNGKWLERIGMARAWMLGAALLVMGVAWMVRA
jgi:hypothetical protein